MCCQATRYTGQPTVSPIVGFFAGIHKICNKTIVTWALILAIVANVILGGSGINSVERLGLVGLSNSRGLECERHFRHHCFRLLRPMTIDIASLWLDSGNNIPILGFHKKKSGISRVKSRMENSIGIYEKNFRPVIGCFSCYATREPRVTLWDVFGGKHINAYIFPSANVYASWMDYFDIYIRNLESEYRIMMFYKLIYLYICAFDLSWVSCEFATLSSEIATLASDILYTLVYLLLKWINSVIRIHDEYQSCFLVGLALTCKASSQIRYILLHYRSSWREL